MKKLKTIITTFLLIIFCIIGGGTFNSDFYIGIGTILIIVAIFFMFVHIIYKHEKKKYKNQLKSVDQEAVYKLWLQNYIKENGNPDKIINIKDNDTSQIIIVHEITKQMYMLGHFLNFKDILSCNCSDSPRIIKGTIISEVSSNNCSAIGRAIIGNAIAGTSGAIIGGTTCGEKAEFIQSDDRIAHDYTIIININSIANPVLSIHTGEDEKLTNEIIGLLNVIIVHK
jgi:hypothetical protein